MLTQQSSCAVNLPSIPIEGRTISIDLDPGSHGRAFLCTGRREWHPAGSTIARSTRIKRRESIHSLAQASH